MQIKYFQDTDTLYVVFKEKEVAQTKDFDENILVDLDAHGDVVSMTIEHARQTADIDNFSFQQIAAEVVA